MSKISIHYRLPDARVVPIHFDESDEVPFTTTFQLADGSFVIAILCGETPAPAPRTFRDCPHDGSFLGCDNCRDEYERQKLRDDPAKSWGYDQCSARVHFAGKALAAAREAGAGSRLLKQLEDFRDQVGNTGD